MPPDRVAANAYALKDKNKSKTPDPRLTPLICSYYKLRHKVDQQHQLWQEGSHPKMIETEDAMWQKIEYTHNNRLRRGYIDDPLHWRYSSARCYAGQPAVIDVCVDWR